MSPQPAKAVVPMTAVSAIGIGNFRWAFPGSYRLAPFSSSASHKLVGRIKNARIKEIKTEIH